MTLDPVALRHLRRLPRHLPPTLAQRLAAATTTHTAATRAVTRATRRHVRYALRLHLGSLLRRLRIADTTAGARAVKTWRYVTLPGLWRAVYRLDSLASELYPR